MSQGSKEFPGFGKKCLQGCVNRDETSYGNLSIPCKAIKVSNSEGLQVPIPTVDNEGIAECKSYEPDLLTSLKSLAFKFHEIILSLRSSMPV